MKAGALLLATPAGAICRCRVPANVRRRRSQGGEKRVENVKRDLIQAAQRRGEDEGVEKSAVTDNGQD